MSVHLLIDAGNTRLKWALWDGTKLFGHGNGVHAETSDRAAVADAAVSACSAPASVVAGNVAGEAMAEALHRAAVRRHGVACRFVAVAPEALGVRIAYACPQRLGVDRWLALLAAHDDPGGACLVVDAGTALTVDALAADGRHLGGLIAPGADLQRRSLLDRTARIGDGGQSLAETAPDLFAADTGDAVTAGAIHGNAALVDRAAKTLASRLGVEPCVLLTGGAAANLAPAVTTPMTRVDDLVLKGLALLVDTDLHKGHGDP